MQSLCNPRDRVLVSLVREFYNPLGGLPSYAPALTQPFSSSGPRTDDLLNMNTGGHESRKGLARLMAE